MCLLNMFVAVDNFCYEYYFAHLPLHFLQQSLQMFAVQPHVIIHAEQVQFLPDSLQLFFPGSVRAAPFFLPGASGTILAAPFFLPGTIGTVIAVISSPFLPGAIESILHHAIQPVHLAAADQTYQREIHCPATFQIVHEMTTFHSSTYFLSNFHHNVGITLPPLKHFVQVRQTPLAEHAMCDDLSNSMIVKVTFSSTLPPSLFLKNMSLLCCQLSIGCRWFSCAHLRVINFFGFLPRRKNNSD